MYLDIVIAPDDNVVDRTYVLLNSIKKSNPQKQINIHLLYCQLNDENRGTIISFGNPIGLKFGHTL